MVCPQRGEIMEAQELIALNDNFGAHNYHPLPVVLREGEGVWVKDVEGKTYLDMLSAYSALNFGHCQPDIVAALVRQAAKLTLTSRAFHNELLGPFLKEVCELTGMEMALPMNTGAEAVETAIKAARKWGYRIKGVPENCAEIVVFSDNFHGRTITIISFSTEAAYRDGFGPFTPGFRKVTFGYTDEIETALNDRTVAVLIEPIQGEGGIIVPENAFLQRTRQLCTERKVLFIADEIQTGLGRTGRLFACEHSGITPDMYILGKALGGGLYPVSIVTSSREVLGVFRPGEHGSTFGGNPLACAVGLAALEQLRKPGLFEHVDKIGSYFMEQLATLRHPDIDHVRGRGLLIGLVLKKASRGARPHCEALANEGLLCKETHDLVIRFAPPLIITREEIDWAMVRIRKVFT